MQPAAHTSAMRGDDSKVGFLTDEWSPKCIHAVAAARQGMVVEDKNAWVFVLPLTIHASTAICYIILKVYAALPSRNRNPPANQSDSVTPMFQSSCPIESQEDYLTSAVTLDHHIYDPLCDTWHKATANYQYQCASRPIGCPITRNWSHYSQETPSQQLRTQAANHASLVCLCCDI